MSNTQTSDSDSSGIPRIFSELKDQQISQDLLASHKTSYSSSSTNSSNIKPNLSLQLDHTVYSGSVVGGSLSTGDLLSSNKTDSGSASTRPPNRRALSGGDGASLRSVSRLPRPPPILMAGDDRRYSLSVSPARSLNSHLTSTSTSLGQHSTPRFELPGSAAATDVISNYSRNSLYRALHCKRNSFSSDSSNYHSEDEDDNSSLESESISPAVGTWSTQYFSATSGQGNSRTSSSIRPVLPRRRSKACDSILDPSDHLHSAFNIQAEESGLDLNQEHLEPNLNLAPKVTGESATSFTVEQKQIQNVAEPMGGDTQGDPLAHINLSPRSLSTSSPTHPITYNNSNHTKNFSSVNSINNNNYQTAIMTNNYSGEINAGQHASADEYYHSGSAYAPSDSSDNIHPGSASFLPGASSATHLDPQQNASSAAGITAHRTAPGVNDPQNVFDEKTVGLGASAGVGAGAGGSKRGGLAGFWSRHKKLCLFLLLLIIIIILVVILVPIGVVVVAGNKDDNKDSNKNADEARASTASSYSGTATATSSLATSTPSASSLPANLKNTIYDIDTWLDTTSFNTTYTSETVGGLPVMGLNSTWDDSAQPNSQVPPLNEDFGYGTRPIRGVNVGGWLILEPFLTPSFFEKHDLSLGIIDEWTLSEYVRENEGDDALKNLLETHYATFVNETTFQEIAEAGLDHVRIPFGYWAIETYDNDTFLPQISWRYLLRGIEWARKYGLRVKVDLHSVPGGQNGWNHSGRQNHLAWLNGTDGELNGNRTLELHAQISEFFAQDRYKNLVTIYGLVNEPRMTYLNVTVVDDWTEQAYDVVSEHDYDGYIVYGDGFLGVDAWKGVFNQTDFPKMVMDVHQYTIFDSYLLQMTHAGKINYVCSEWKNQLNRSLNPLTGHGYTFVGEWSQADNDCTPYLNNVGVGSRWEGTFDPNIVGTNAVLTPSCNGQSGCSCTDSVAHPSNYSDAYKTFLLHFAEVQMEVFEEYAWGFMYWNWDTETYNATQWSYKKGREYGILPQLAYERSFNCSAGTPDYASMGLPETY